METITIDKFKKLIPCDTLDKPEAYGDFGMEGEKHSEQCENLRIGDKVKFIRVQQGSSDPEFGGEIVLVEAKVVEEKRGG